MGGIESFSRCYTAGHPHQAPLAERRGMTLCTKHQSALLGGAALALAAGVTDPAAAESHRLHLSFPPAEQICSHPNAIRLIDLLARQSGRLTIEEIREYLASVSGREPAPQTLPGEPSFRLRSGGVVHITIGDCLLVTNVVENSRSTPLQDPRVAKPTGKTGAEMAGPDGSVGEAKPEETARETFARIFGPPQKDSDAERQREEAVEWAHSHLVGDDLTIFLLLTEVARAYEKQNTEVDLTTGGDSERETVRVTRVEQCHDQSLPPSSRGQPMRYVYLYAYRIDRSQVVPIRLRYDVEDRVVSLTRSSQSRGAFSRDRVQLHAMPKFSSFSRTSLDPSVRVSPETTLSGDLCTEWRRLFKLLVAQ